MKILRSRRAALGVVIGGAVAAGLLGIVTELRSDETSGWLVAGIVVVAVITAAGALLLDRASSVEVTPTKVSFVSADWVDGPPPKSGEMSTCELRVPRARHGKSRPAVDALYLDEGGVSVKVEGDSDVTEDGTLVVSLAVGPHMPVAPNGEVWIR